MNELTDGATRHWVNGMPGDSLSVSDRGLQYGDGLFETIVVRAKQVRFLGLHLQRLRRGCEILQIGPLDYSTVESELRTAASLSECAMMKLIVTRGPALQRGYSGVGCLTPTRVLTLTHGIAAHATTARLALSHVLLGDNALLAGIKHLNRLENVLARSAMPAGVDEVLMCDGRGHIVCGAMSNLFVVRNQFLLTPRLDRCGVAGILRQVALREAQRVGLVAHETELRATDLAGADEIFLTNVRVGVWPVTQFAARELAVGAVTSALRTRVEALNGIA